METSPYPAPQAPSHAQVAENTVYDIRDGTGEYTEYTQGAEMQARSSSVSFWPMKNESNFLFDVCEILIELLSDSTFAHWNYSFSC